MPSSLMKSTGVVAAMTFLSRMLGFARDVVFAVAFGASPEMDAFLVAFKIPNFMRRLFAEGAFAQSFVPVLSATRSAEDDTAVRELLDAVVGTLGVILLGVTVLGVIGAPILMLIFAPGFTQHGGDQFALGVSMLRWTFPYLLFISLTACAGGVLNTYNKFAVPAFTPVLLNLCLIGAALGLAPLFTHPVVALAVGVFAAGVVQLAFQIPSLLRLKLLPRPRWGWYEEKVRRIIRMMLPILFGSSVAQINLLLDTIIASLLATGSVSWLYFSDRLMEFPLGVFSIAVATVILPTLSARHAKASTQAFSDTLDWALQLIVVIGLPAMVGLFVLAGPLVTTLFQYRSFTPFDVLMSRDALMAYAFGFMGFSLVKVLVPGFYARQDSKTPVRCGVISLLSAMAMDVLFVGGMKLLDIPAPHAGLALAASLGAFINAGLLYHYLRKDDILRPGPRWRFLLVQVSIASVAMGALLWWLAGDLDGWLAWDVWHRTGMLVGLVLAGFVFYFGLLFVFGMRPRHLMLEVSD